MEGRQRLRFRAPAPRAGGPGLQGGLSLFGNAWMEEYIGSAIKSLNTEERWQPSLQRTFTGDEWGRDDARWGSVGLLRRHYHGESLEWDTWNLLPQRTC